MKGIRRILIILALLMSGRAFAIDYNPDGTIKPVIDWYVKNIKAELYEITNPYELAGLAALVNGTTGFFSPYDFTGKTVVLANDIDMESYVDETTSSVKGCKWIPIGINYSARFAGAFDGQGYAIKNLIITGENSGTLFGYNSGTIRNLVIAGGMISADYYGAGICSHNSGTIDHCINTANIFCNNYGGGIVGKNYGDGTITNCINIGYVQNGNFCGGIVGSNAPSGTLISNCVYDIQTCPLKKGCGTIDNKSIKGLPTSQIVAGLNFDMSGFAKEEGLYPRLEISTLNDALRAALSIVKMPDNQSAAGVNRDFEIIKSPGVEYSSSNETFLEIQDTKCEVKGSACVSIIIKGGNCTRNVIVKLTMQHALVTGTSSSPIRIKDYKDFLQFANAVNYCTNYKGIACVDGFKDIHFALMGNIYIPESTNWMPIGSPKAPFNGIFSGYGHVVANMSIMRPLEKYCGLFGYSNGTISKVCLVGGHVFGGDYTGAICGYNTGTIEKCINTLPLRGHYYCGGICGFNSGGKITYTLQINSVDGLDEYTGAICGGAIGGNVTNCFFDDQLCVGQNAVGDNELLQITNTEGRNTTNLIGDKLKGKSGFDIDFVFVDRFYPRILSSESFSEAIVASTPIFIGKGETARSLMSFIELDKNDSIKYECRQNDVLQVKDDKALPLKQGAVMFIVTDGKVKKEIKMRISNPSLSPSGTANKPLLISSYEDLRAFSDAVNFGSDYKGYACIDGFEDVHFKIENDITCPSDGEMWPIGNILSPFNGVLDGNNKRIYNFRCDQSSYDNIGFIGYNAGLVKNVRLSDANIKGHYYTGGICGFNVGRIESCMIDSSRVKADNYCGGICGFDNGEISRCVNNSTVICDYYVGGICGSNSGRIDSCTNNKSGHITGVSCVGGITGSNNAEVNACSNLGTVTGRDNTGGISGRNSFSLVSKCTNSGKVNGGDCSGGIAGFNDGTISKCINESSVEATYAAGGIAGKGGKVEGSTNKGLVQSNGNNAGGIVGVTKSTSEIRLCNNLGSIKAQAFVGGICSDNVQGRITSCISRGHLSAAYYVGGIVGYNSGTVTSNIFLGTLDGSSYYGSICGRENDGTIERCIYDKEVTSTGGIDGKDVPMKAVGYKTEQLKGEIISGMLNKDDFKFKAGEYPDVNLNAISTND
ncbi:MAG: hypothetical protein J6X05_06880 [Bacteroidales bacterium]|nr:hypothetical protein [Bacteroidales bacterium]